MGYIYQHRCLISVHEIVGICGIYMVFEEHISYCHIYGYSMVNNSCSLFIF